jgi:hypothetical protein
MCLLGVKAFVDRMLLGPENKADTATKENGGEYTAASKLDI